MRGRTNIPPRVGGIVKGDIVTYQVQDVNGIGIGDYVQLIKGTGSVNTTSPLMDENAIFGPFLLSNDKPVLFHVFKSVAKLYASTWNVEESGVSDPVSVEIDTSALPLQPGAGVPGYQQLIELSRDEFLLILANSTSSRVFAKVSFTGGSWSVHQVIESSEFSLWTSSNSWKWFVENDRIFVSSKGKIVIGYFVDENTISFSSYTSSVESSEANGALSVVNNFLVHIRSTQIELWKLVGSYIEFTNIYTLDSLSNSFDGDYVKASEDVLMFVIGQSTSYTSSQANKYFNAVVLKIGTDGSVSEKIIPNAVYFTTVGSSSSPTGAVISTYGKLLSSGKILLIALEQYRSPRTTYKYNIEAVHACICDYEERDESVTFGKSSRIPVSFTSYQADKYDVLDICDIGSGRVFTIIWNVSTSDNRGYINSLAAKIEQSSVVPLSKIPFVSSYRTEINGIAKTPGANGEAIEVYIPYRKEG